MYKHFKNSSKENTKIRVTGSEEQIEELINQLQHICEIKEKSNYFPNRGSATTGRVYLEVVVK